MPTSKHARAVALLSTVLAACAPAPPDLATCGQLASCASGPNYAFEGVRLVVPDEQGHVEGFDLDGVASDANEGKGCRVVDGTAPDGTPGIDNRLPQVLALAGAGFADAAAAGLTNAILTGAMLTLLEFVPGTDGAAGYSHLVLRQGSGVPLVGTDRRYLPHQTISLVPQPLMGIAHGTGDAGAWVTDAPFPIDFRLEFLGTPLRFRLEGSRVKTRALGDGRLDVLFGGYMSVADATGLATYLGGGDDDLGTLLADALPALADIRSREDECDAISLALVFHAVPVFVHPEVKQGALTVEELFVRATCRGCHATRDVSQTGGGVGAGPSLVGLGAAAATRVPGLSARDYVVQSIREPGAHVVPGYDDTMPAAPGRNLADDELERIVAWLLEQ